jgi:hypothetical protein
MNPRVMHGFALVEGNRFDLNAVLSAYEAVVDALAEEFSDGATTLATAHEEYAKKIPWPEPGKAMARRAWYGMADLYEVVDEALVHAMGRITVKAFLLGKTWCVHHPATGRLTTPRGEDVSTLEPQPVICLYGEQGGPNEYAVADAADIAIARRVITTDLAHLGLAFETSQPVVDPATGRNLLVAFVTFPHALYGKGRDIIRVRCVEPDGEPADTNQKAN